ncbi:MAG: hypothetical protein JNN24_06550 [Hyphomicrobium zavarzinii]|jgi:hypothetical protein|uniref:hypothetical protein n=1 Tax=Hyphomicrobium zavarzinii TaxID=48292 RepID=UPI00036D4127|nr:hypothetical protein [Hyphomicrobium zavarzinii]MBL8845415.1 hypothetical protein [Hyphomicrobium zavarzinii]HML42382.1 hypothetical protein [Hyphomicrobium zavarzinii]
MYVSTRITTVGLALAGTLALMTATASAAVVCNAEGDCWRVKERHEYKPEFGLRVYADDWRWPEAEAHRYRWREVGHGRGYWHNGIWIEF